MGESERNHTDLLIFMQSPSHGFIPKFKRSYKMLPSLCLFFLNSSSATAQFNSSLYLSTGGKEGKHSHKHTSLGQSWFHNPFMTSCAPSLYISPHLFFFFSSLYTSVLLFLLLHHLLLISPCSCCRSICLLFCFALFPNLPYLLLSFYVLYHHTPSPTL